MHRCGTRGGGEDTREGLSEKKRSTFSIWYSKKGDVPPERNIDLKSQEPVLIEPGFPEQRNSLTGWWSKQSEPNHKDGQETERWC